MFSLIAALNLKYFSTYFQLTLDVRFTLTCIRAFNLLNRVYNCVLRDFITRVIRPRFR